MSKIKLAIVSRDYKEYLSMFECEAQLLQNYEVIYAGTDNDSVKLRRVQNESEVLISEPDIAAKFAHKCQSLLWIQSTWAGNNVLQKSDLKHIKVSGVKGIFAQRMSEYVLSYILYFHRKIEQYQNLKSKGVWQQLPIDILSNKTLGIMGLGSIGKQVASAANNLGMKVLGYSNSIKNITGVSEYIGDDLYAFTAKCDYLVNLLPETDTTIGMCDAKFFNHMKKNSIFINAGRGSIIDEPTSLIMAINKGFLSGAVLDVFEQEPLPQEHPYYLNPNIHITCHTAAVSEPTSVFEVFLENAQRYTNNNELLYLHDFNKGY
ncbi:D-2-hydroxyacid dehydrogenase [Glaciecola petra]|uniref:D-2-hydroxyacid dehydrogenase n=1 Tax=Glaciecola petra TaxID=3075602 RepID=A0ABU2ZTP8_9ALTE|nr:D-2-hydroxyacid dehydrogenase [Aestuariibacter sp. P117]MDT0596013.1 D-2-hydroxyacid dehydrogenase [Aestuariibacter sp. P117]